MLFRFPFESAFLCEISQWFRFNVEHLLRKCFLHLQSKCSTL